MQSTPQGSIQPQRPFGPAALVALNLALAAVYFGAARLGLSLAFTAEQVTVVWPPTGIALAAMYLLGYRMWPGILLGAFLANVIANEPILTVFGIALGNTLEALAGAFMLRCWTEFHPSLTRIRDVFAITILAAALSTKVSATIGVFSLCAGGVQPWSQFGTLWRLWWMGDGLGNLIVAPLLLTWCSPTRIKIDARRAAEIGLYQGLILTCMILIFFRPHRNGEVYTSVFAILPLMFWSAARTGPRFAALATALASWIAISGTLQKLGPFAWGTLPEMEMALIYLELFMGTVSVSSLLLASANAERLQTENALRESQRKLLLLADDLEQQVQERTAVAEQRAKQLQTMAVQLTQAESTERKRLAAILHDDLQQMLVAAKYKNNGLRNRSGDRDEVLNCVREVDSILDQCINSSRSLSHELNPAALQAGGFCEALRWLSEQKREKFGLSIKLEVCEEPIGLSDEAKMVLYQSIRELLFNIIKHAGTSNAYIEVGLAGDEIRVLVADEGKGFDVAHTLQQSHRGVGLLHLRERIGLMGGKMEIKSAPGKGSQFTLWMPLTAEPHTSDLSPPHIPILEPK